MNSQALSFLNFASLRLCARSADSEPKPEAFDFATQVAIDILKKGGSAVAAAIAANATLAVVEPAMCGIGGDLFAIVWSQSEQRLYGLNASGRSPDSLTLEEFRRRGIESIPAASPFSQSVPGAVDG